MVLGGSLLYLLARLVAALKISSEYLTKSENHFWNFTNISKCFLAGNKREETILEDYNSDLYAANVV